MDLFWLDKQILNFFTNFNYYQLFMSTMFGYISTILLYGTFSNNRGNRK